MENKLELKITDVVKLAVDKLRSTEQVPCDKTIIINITQNHFKPEKSTIVFKW